MANNSVTEKELDLYDIVLESLTSKNVTITQKRYSGATLYSETFVVNDDNTHENIFSVTKTHTTTGAKGVSKSSSFSAVEKEEDSYEYSMDYKNKHQNVSKEFARKVFNKVEKIMEKQPAQNAVNFKTQTKPDFDKMTFWQRLLYRCASANDR